MVNEKWAVEDGYEPKVREILAKEGFKDIKRMPRFSLYDYEATKDGDVAYIEVRGRSDSTSPVFYIRESKIMRLMELSRKMKRKVYLLLLWRNEYALIDIFKVPLHSFKVNNFKVYISKDREFPEELKQKIIELYRAGYKIPVIARMLGINRKAVKSYIRRNLTVKMPYSREIIFPKRRKRREYFIAIRANENTYMLWRKLIGEKKKMGKKACEVFEEMLKYYVARERLRGLSI